MIIGHRKPLEEILQMIEPFDKIVLIGCKGCVTVCSAGGEKEAGILASALRLARQAEGNPIEIKEISLERQCDPEYLEPLRRDIGRLSGGPFDRLRRGVQFLAEKFRKHVPVLPGVNTIFMGVTEEQGVWAERCQGCGNCVLDMTGGICPIARCSKSLLNGPCGGSSGGKCEIDPEVECGWQLIYDRLQALGQLEKMYEVVAPQDWSTSRDGGPRKRIVGGLREMKSGSALEKILERRPVRRHRRVRSSPRGPTWR